MSSADEAHITDQPRRRRYGKPYSHGGFNTPEYAAWAGMKARCSNPRHPFYADYGGRGIVVCPEWESSFPAFLAHIGPRPSPACSLDRIRNDEGYVPGNVRWATKTTQSRNSRAARIITFRGAEMTLGAACDLAGLARNTVAQRLFKGWDIDRALSTPLDQNRSLARRAK